ncbi:nascent polypeptide-associated complex subunit alpha, muscle-specific form-like [Colius striatus]|uniref:nascent polypeptide-associated complex subunit alpha, muscle-specific form-like n=1 Tax=Colius striatus TaxID=57412 RepID=UPI002B1E53A1|nr:nascent polypeptide-associated complex subunit alpha, muscle-specific form-like [Colius striatus]XP_061869913.1 nascent polypeptide-associated complex subunit alpha, muscle-specific form-like [Colius striatus]XP_061869914.1 nascent polypeptide-associated complex subunit alpha, muscle-specific form-like [Colius striatus]XP_061869915.1 nascent polypeptide-associated complex subunit alpha, muscle-specific form-like [Colius striatus]XP_061869916.1 nascent polypeptide-associated complex subunit a
MPRRSACPASARARAGRGGPACRRGPGWARSARLRSRRLSACARLSTGPVWGKVPLLPPLSARFRPNCAAARRERLVPEEPVPCCAEPGRAGSALAPPPRRLPALPPRFRGARTSQPPHNLPAPPAVSFRRRSARPTPPPAAGRPSSFPPCGPPLLFLWGRGSASFPLQEGTGKRFPFTAPCSPFSGDRLGLVSGEHTSAPHPPRLSSGLPASRRARPGLPRLRAEERGRQAGLLRALWPRPPQPQPSPGRSTCLNSTCF